MEAFWTRFQPSFNKALEILHSGRLGALKIVSSNFAFNADFNPEKRLYNVDLGGGSLLDIGIYPVFASLATLGKTIGNTHHGRIQSDWRRRKYPDELQISGWANGQPEFQLCLSFVHRNRILVRTGSGKAQSPLVYPNNHIRLEYKFPAGTN